MFYTPSRLSRLHTTSPRMSLRSQATNVYAAEAVQLPSYMKHTGTASSVPHGNENWISKPSDTSFLTIGRMVQTITNPTLGSINSCVLTQPRARSTASKVNATSRVPTDSLQTTSTAPGKIKQPSNVLGSYVVLFLDNPGPALIDLPESSYNTALHAPCGSWCLQTHEPHQPASRRLTGLTTSRLLSPPLPSSPRLRPTSRLLLSPLPSSPRLRPTSQRLSSQLRRSP